MQTVNSVLYPQYTFNSLGYANGINLPTQPVYAKLPTIHESLLPPLDTPTVSHVIPPVAPTPPNPSVVGTGTANNVGFGSRLKTAIDNTTKEVQSAWAKMPLGEKANTLLGTVNGVMNAYNAYKANKLANEQFALQKQAYHQNFEANKRMVNSQLHDRQTARYANSNKNMSVNEYMNRYGVQ